MPVTLPGSVFRFGNFELDCSRFELRLNGRSVRLERKPMELLILLVSREGLLVTREEITQRLWSSEVFVDTEHGINTAIRKLRHLLRDDPDNPRFILTVTGQGYRFIARVDTVVLAVASPSALVASEPYHATSAPVPAPAIPSLWKALGWYVGVGICLAVAIGGIAFYRSRPHPPSVRYTQLTDFTDSAVQPALSPDGHLMAFIRGGNTFITSDQIYVKMLPSGEARRVTNDQRPKYGLAFSPDGSEISYTVLDGSTFSTYQVSALGGEPQLLQRNAAGLAWLDPKHVLFSEAPSGIHLSLVTATSAGTDLREIYSPVNQRGMAHYAFPSPDRKWALIVEMLGDGEWGPCRLVALDGRNESRTVGPSGACTSAGWSPEGLSMYFTASADGNSHLWQQSFPDGKAEQITFGPTEEQGLAVEPTGHALITSVGVHQSAIWIHDPSGERSLSSEGEVLGWPLPVFSQDGNVIYYLLRRWQSSGAELWCTTVKSGVAEPVLPGISMSAFDISLDGSQVVYTTPTANGSTDLWRAPTDRQSPPTKLRIAGARWPRFGQRGQIIFQRAEGGANYLEEADADGAHVTTLLPYPILDLQGISPNRTWVTVAVPKTEPDDSAAVVAVSLLDKSTHRICVGYCVPRWSTNGDYFFIPLEDPARTRAGRSLAIPVGPHEIFPELPARGIAPMTEASVVTGARTVPRAMLIPGKDPDHYAWINTSVQRNLYRISLP